MSQFGPNGSSPRRPPGDGSNVYRFRPPSGGPPRRDHEPAFNAPWPPLALGVLLIALYAVQSFSGQGPAMLRAFALVPTLFLQGQLWTLVTHLFLHGFWAHAILNAVGILAFGAPVARWLGERGAGPLRFFGFFLACGVIAALGYVLIHPDSQGVLVGASGGAAGLMGAASRMFSDPNRLSGFGDRTVAGLAVGWLILNLAFAVLGVIPGFGGAGVAWEAHLVGYAAGLFLIGPYGRLTRRRVD